MGKIYRKLTRVITARPSADGNGVNRHRIAGSKLAAQLDPLLLLDEIRSERGADYIGGFPAHPHRGFETVTYMLQGAMRHRDHMGNEGLLNSGDVQWMTAGRGIIHSEMPEQQDGLLHGFQLWLNLPASDKMQPASYRDFRSDAFPVLNLAHGGRVKIIAGEVLTERGLLQSPVNNAVASDSPVYQRTTQPIYLDVHLPAGAEFQHSLPANHSVALYVYEGGTTELSQRQMGLYTRGDTLRIIAAGQGVKALLLAARPLKEPIKQYGPFVMNTADEIQQAIEDYNNGELVA